MSGPLRGPCSSRSCRRSCPVLQIGQAARQIIFGLIIMAMPLAHRDPWPACRPALMCRVGRMASDRLLRRHDRASDPAGAGSPSRPAEIGGPVGGSHVRGSGRCARHDFWLDGRHRARHGVAICDSARRMPARPDDLPASDGAAKATFNERFSGGDPDAAPRRPQRPAPRAKPSWRRLAALIFWSRMRRLILLRQSRPIRRRILKAPDDQRACRLRIVPGARPVDEESRGRRHRAR